MKVTILAGGFGTRLSEYTESIPKPMVLIGGYPIIWHIMRHYAKFGYKDFQLALGYKAEVIKEYFIDYQKLNSDFTFDFSSGEVIFHNLPSLDWKVTLVQTGLDSMTGGRLKRMQPYLKNDPFLLTYGDGVSDININKLVKFHREHGKMVTVSAVRPTARFGELVVKNNIVTSFREKPQMDQGWINGGYFVIEPKFFDLIEGDSTVLEKEPLEKVAEMGELMAYFHDGFWQCMDTKRDKDVLEKLWEANKAPWA